MFDTIETCSDDEFEKEVSSVGALRSRMIKLRNDGNIEALTMLQARLRETDLEDCCEDLLQIVRGPHEHLLSLASAHRIVAALQYAVYFDLPSYIPNSAQDGGVKYSDVAARAGGPPERECSRVLRLLMTCGLFCEPESGFVAHNDASLPLLDPEIKGVLGNMTDEAFKSAAFLAQATERSSHSEERTDAPFNLAFGTSLPMFDYFSAKAPWRAERFGQVMSTMSKSPRFSLDHLVHGFPWREFPAGSTVVDVGGSIGHCSRAIIGANPNIRCIVQDLASALGIPAGQQKPGEQIEFMEYDFWTPQLVSADIYFLRWILHDYPDHEACKILSNQVTAMKTGSRLVIMDRIIARPGEKSRVDERNDRLQDIGMWTLINGRERDIHSWKSLLHGADERLRLESIVTPVGSALSLLVASLDN